MIAADSLYKGFRFPEEIISHAVWLYYDSCSACVTCRNCCSNAASWDLRNFLNVS